MAEALTVPEAFGRALAARGGTPDATQLQVADRLERFREEWIAYKSRRSNAVTRMLVHPAIPRGLYLWGGVGRGKSLLMDSCFATMPIVRKGRLHFHEFMRGVHRDLQAVSGTADPLDEVGLRVARRYRLIFFDEFHVSDIADAMILHRLLARLFALRVGFVMTSNYPPEGLYPEGLHRERVLPAIELIREHMDVLQVDAGVDYRLQAMERIPAYFVGTVEAGLAHLREAFDRVADGADADPVLHIEARRIRARRRAGGVVWFDFAELCGGPRSHNDYLEIAAQFHTVLLSGVPRLSAGQSSEARRFTWLVDILYDHRIKLYAAAAVPPAEIYTAGVLAQEFDRTASRLIEMQTREYAAQPRRDVHLD